MSRAKNSAEEKISEALYFHLTKHGQWEDKRYCFVLSGQRGSGKTTTALRVFEHKKHFYFSFQGLCSGMSLKLLCKALADKGVELQGDSWAEVFAGLNVLAKNCRIIIFDDLDEMMLE